MTGIASLIDKHRSAGLLVDSNLLLLFVVGKLGKQKIQTCKRTQMYTGADYELLNALVAKFPRLLTTPHILTEVSNLAALHGTDLRRFRAVLRENVDLMEEFYAESRAITTHTLFSRLGLTDTAIAMLAEQQPLVLTDDLDLHVALLKRNVDAVNFNHIRTAFW